MHQNRKCNAQFGKNKWGRLERYKNRNGPRKKVTDSWDRDLSIGELKWSSRGPWNLKNSQYVLVFLSRLQYHVVYRHIFDVLVSGKAPKAWFWCSKNNFRSQFDQKCTPDHCSNFYVLSFFSIFDFLHFSQFRPKRKVANFFLATYPPLPPTLRL